MENKIPAYLFLTSHDQNEPADVKSIRFSFLDKTVINSARAVKSIYIQAESAQIENIIQKVNPYVKIIVLIYLAIVISIVHDLYKQAFISVFIFLLYLLARFRVIGVYAKIVTLAFLFGFLAVLPASLNIVTRGNIILNLISFEKPTHFLIYDIPQTIGFTDNGFQVVLLIFLRVLNSVSLALLIVFTTPFSSFIKSFKILGIPDTFLMIVSLAYKFIFVLSRTVEETYFALKSRLAGNIKNRNIRNLISGRIFFIFKKSGIIYESTYLAMISRGYDGKVKLYTHYHFTFADLISIIIIVAVSITIILF